MLTFRNANVKQNVTMLTWPFTVATVNGESASQWLKKTRVAAGYPKQENLASAVGVGRGAVGNWETGGRPALENVSALAAALGVDPQEIIERFGIKAGGEIKAAMPSWAGELVVRMERLERAVAERPADYATSVPPAVARTRRHHWIDQARLRLGAGPGKKMSTNEIAARMNLTGAMKKQVAAWAANRSDIDPAYFGRLARALHIPERDLIDPPETDQERLDRWAREFTEVEPSAPLERRQRRAS